MLISESNRICDLSVQRLELGTQYPCPRPVNTGVRPVDTGSVGAELFEAYPRLDEHCQCGTVDRRLVSSEQEHRLAPTAPTIYLPRT